MYFFIENLLSNNWMKRENAWFMLFLTARAAVGVRA